MAFTLEQIEAIEDADFTPEIETALFTKLGNRATSYLTKNGHVVKPTADYDKDVETKAAAKTQDAIDKEGAKLFGSIDRLLSFIFNEQKPQAMRTRDWVAQFEDKGLLPVSEESAEKIKKALLGEGMSNSKAEGIVKALEEKVQELTDKETNKAAQALEKSVKRDVKASFSTANVVVDAGLKGTELDKAKKAAISDLTDFFNTKYEGHEDENGELFYTKKGDKTALMGADGQALTPLQIIKANHKTFLAVEGHQQQGGGTGRPEGQQGGTPKTMSDLVKLAYEQGLRFGSPAYTKFIDEKKAEYSIK